jgi:hypothetical protein
LAPDNRARPHTREALPSEPDPPAIPETAGAPLPTGERQMQREPGSVEQVAHGQAYTQVGHSNTQLHVTGLLVQIGASVEHAEMSAAVVRGALADPAAWHDLLEEQLIR